ncbi:2Fe-2S iron-sulfur cluster-binding protein [Sphingopyxis granuli]|uniref:Ferredoxin reductase n=2 Tax=Sphingopyxis TaxID=165697 RepID=Q8GJE9_SPHMC|nr:2Fe-2S iron-sulfur cluster-binding protein [Sphingopyxis granuli]AAN26446.1 ferredoxin reductase [Sphingopyxis macrogoltabida]AMG75152.1 Ferredoxin reductase [Sphingopyxis granuli]
MGSARIEILDQGEFQAEEGELLLREALRNRIGFPYDCNSGGCGSCQFELVSGGVEDAWSAAPGLSERARSRGRRLACQSRVTGDCAIKVRLKPEFVPTHPPALHSARYEGCRPLTSDMAEYRFRCDGSADFLPGQYAMLRLPGVSGDRAYSMSNLPNADGLWTFIIKHISGGQGSGVLAEKIRPGDLIGLDGPYGLSFLRPDADHDIVCIGGGSGISPLKSICSAAVRHPPLDNRTIHLFYGARTPSDLPIDRTFREDPQLAERVTVVPAISEASHGTSWSGETGMIHEVLHRWLETVGDAKRFEYYFCGPPPMIDAVRRLLQIDLRVPETQLHADSFV